ncbi:MAG: hypothetical protein IJ673_07570 [Treponema sp.]|nr:hypothetical protein [Treponema sp.]
MKKIFALAPAAFVAAAFITTVFSCGSALDDVKGDIEADIEQARTESYFRLYGLFENVEVSGKVGSWNCAKIELLGTKGYFVGSDSSGNKLIKGNYFYMEKPSSGEYYKAPDKSGSYADDYQSPDDFEAGELWLNVKYTWDGGWKYYSEDTTDGSFFVAEVDIPAGGTTFKSAQKKTKDDYDKRKADAHDYASHKFHYALEFYTPDNKYCAYDELTKDYFKEAYPDREIIKMMDKLESALPSSSDANVEEDGSDIVLSIGGQRLSIKIYDYNGYDTDLIFTAKDSAAELADSDYFGLVSYSTPHWNEKVWLRDNYPNFSALFDDVLKKATDIKMEKNGGSSYFAKRYDMNAHIARNLDELEEKLETANPSIAEATDGSGRLIVDFGSAKVKARVLKNLLKNTPDVEFTSISAEEDEKVESAGLWGLYEYSGNTYSPNIARNERLWLREQYPNLNSLIESIIDFEQN